MGWGEQHRPVRAAVEDLEREAHAAGIEVGVERERARWAALLESEAGRYPASDEELPVQHYIDGHRDTITRLRQHVTA